MRYFVKDLDASLRFYTEVLGFIVSDRDASVAYLRGIEETCHHSVVLHALRRPSGRGMYRHARRPLRKTTLNVAFDYFIAAGGSAEFVERPYQGLSLLTTFGPGTPPIELCSGMPVLPRYLNNFPASRKGVGASCASTTTSASSRTPMTQSPSSWLSAFVRPSTHHGRRHRGHPRRLS